MWCSSSNTTANKMPLLCWGWIWVIMCNLPSLYLRCRLTARCEGMSEVAGKGFSAAFEVHGGIDKPCSETWAGMKTSWNNQTLQTKSVCLFSDVILLMLALYTVLHISLYLEQCDKDRSAKKRRKEKKKRKKLKINLKCLSVNAGGFFCPSQIHARMHLHIFYAPFTFLLWGVTPGWAENNMNQAEENVF